MRRRLAAAQRAARGREGFSLIEVVIAIGILGFGLLTFALMQLYSLTQGSAGRHSNDAASIGRSYLEQVHRLPWTELTAELGQGWQTPAWAGLPENQTHVTAPDGTATVEHDYTVDWRVSPVGASTCLRDVEVRQIRSRPSPRWRQRRGALRS